MVRTGRGEQQLKNWPLEFGITFRGWQQPVETSDPFLPQESQISSLDPRGRVSWKGAHLCHSRDLSTR